MRISSFCSSVRAQGLLLFASTAIIVSKTCVLSGSSYIIKKGELFDISMLVLQPLTQAMLKKVKKLKKHVV